MKPNPQHWRKRTPAHYDNIAALLRERAELGLGVRASEMYERSDLYGRSPRNRVSELRRDGWSIGGKAHGESDWFYWLRSDNAGHAFPQTRRFDEPPNSPRPQLVAQPQPKDGLLFELYPRP